jgi:hypothetical protein
MQLNPYMAMHFTTPQAGRAWTREILQAFNVRSMQAFLGSPVQDLTQQMALDQMPMPAVAPPMLPGMGMGQPGMGGPPQGQPPMAPMPQGVQ